MKTKTFTDKYNALFEQIEHELKQRIIKIGEASNWVNSNCLDIRGLQYEYAEIVYLNERIILLDFNGLHFDLLCMDFQELCEITDKLKH